jgi:CBS domain containing-hemolysin-like protein
MIALLIVVGTIVVASATCSLFEAVLYSVPRSRIESLVQAGRPSGRLLNDMRRHVDRPIAAILSLNTIANTGGGALAGALAASALGGANVLSFSVAFTLVILVFAEVLPKTIGVVYSHLLAPYIARPLQLLVVLFRPVVAVAQLATKLIPTGHHDRPVSDEDVLAMVGTGLRAGSFTPDEAEVIKNVLALENRTASDIMTPRPVVFALGSLVTVRDAFTEELRRHSRVPVYDGDNPEDLVGVVHRVDILTAMADDRFASTVEELMRPIHFVVETATLDKLLRRFLEQRQHLVAVIDEFGTFAGIVTLEDVLEDLIGAEIVDETDQVSDLRAFAHERRDALLRGRHPAETADRPPGNGQTGV